MGSTDGKNVSFIAIRMRMQQHNPRLGLEKKSRPEAMPKFLIVMCIYMWYIGYCYCISGHSLGALMYLKTKTLNSGIISVVFLSCFKKFKCLGDVFGFCMKKLGKRKMENDKNL